MSNVIDAVFSWQLVQLNTPPKVRRVRGGWALVGDGRVGIMRKTRAEAEQDLAQWVSFKNKMIRQTKELGWI